LNKKVDNKRSDNRLDINLTIEVTLPSGQKAQLSTRNISTTGVYLQRSDLDLPPVGSVIQLKLNHELGFGDAPIVNAKVVREDEGGIGVQFLEQD